MERPVGSDAEGLEHPGEKILVSGDRRHGGVMKSWFRLTETDLPSGKLVFDEVKRAGDAGLVGRLVDSVTGAGVADAAISINNENINTVTDSDGGFQLSFVSGLYLHSDRKRRRAHRECLGRSADPLSLIPGSGRRISQVSNWPTSTGSA